MVHRSSIAATALAVAVFTGCMTTGCMTVGRPFPTQEVRQIETGKTTREEVKEMFGEPWRTGLEDGESTWTYGHYRYSLFGDGMTRDLVVRFDGRGVVSTYSFNSTVAGDI